MKETRVEEKVVEPKINSDLSLIQNKKWTLAEKKELKKVVGEIKKDFKVRNNNARSLGKTKGNIKAHCITQRLCYHCLLLALLLAFMGFYCFAVSAVHYYNHLNFELSNLPNACVIIEMSTTGEFDGSDATRKTIFDNSYGYNTSGFGEYVQNIENEILKLEVPVDDEINESSLGFTMYLRFYNCMLPSYVYVNGVLPIEFSNGPALDVKLTAYGCEKSVENIKYYDGQGALHYDTIVMPVAITGGDTSLKLEFSLKNYSV